MKNAEQRGLAATARTDNRNEFAGRDLERDVAQHFEIVAPSLLKVLQTLSTRSIFGR